jgi:hypothetical protein
MYFSYKVLFVIKCYGQHRDVIETLLANFLVILEVTDAFM